MSSVGRSRPGTVHWSNPPLGPPQLGGRRNRPSLSWRAVPPPSEPCFRPVSMSNCLDIGSRDSDWLRDGRPRGRGSSPNMGKISLLHVVQTALRPNGYRGLFPRRQSGWGVKLTIHLQLVPRSRIRGSIHPLPYTCSWHSAYLVQSYLTVLIYKSNFCYKSWCAHNNNFHLKFSKHSRIVQPWKRR
jgi:hypothetical protein